ncbi:MAG: hypothetical protein ACREU2_17165 [Steroidobacteraceae bacterium]
MTAVETLQRIQTDTEHQLLRLNMNGSRMYEISTTGTIVEQTAQLREYYESVRQRLQHVIETLKR